MTLPIDRRAYDDGDEAELPEDREERQAPPQRQPGPNGGAIYGRPAGGDPRQGSQGQGQRPQGPRPEERQAPPQRQPMSRDEQEAYLRKTLGGQQGQGQQQRQAPAAKDEPVKDKKITSWKEAVVSFTFALAVFLVPGLIFGIFGIANGALTLIGATTVFAWAGGLSLEHMNTLGLSLGEAWQQFGLLIWIFPISISLIEIVASPFGESRVPGILAEYKKILIVSFAVSLLIDMATTWFGIGTANDPILNPIKENIPLRVLATFFLTVAPEIVMMAIFRFMKHTFGRVAEFIGEQGSGAQSAFGNLRNRLAKK